LASLGHPSKFQRVSRLGSVTALHSNSGRQPNFAASDRGRHLHSAGRPSRWALAHISSLIIFRYLVRNRTRVLFFVIQLTPNKWSKCTAQSYSPGGANVHPNLIHTSLAHPSPHPKRHLDRFNRFAWLTIVTVRPTDNATPSVAIDRIYVVL